MRKRLSVVGVVLRLSGLLINAAYAAPPRNLAFDAKYPCILLNKEGWPECVLARWA